MVARWVAHLVVPRVGPSVHHLAAPKAERKAAERAALTAAMMVSRRAGCSECLSAGMKAAAMVESSAVWMVVRMEYLTVEKTAV
jgi:hypothetical protein